MGVLASIELCKQVSITAKKLDKKWFQRNDDNIVMIVIKHLQMIQISLSSTA